MLVLEAFQDHGINTRMNDSDVIKACDWRLVNIFDLHGGRQFKR